MSTLVQPALRTPKPRAVAEKGGDVPRSIAEEHRWVLWIMPSFLAEAVFFAIAIVTGAEWPIGPAVVLGPIAMICAFIYLCVSCDSNGAGWHVG